MVAELQVFTIILFQMQNCMYNRLLHQVTSSNNMLNNRCRLYVPSSAEMLVTV